MTAILTLGVAVQDFVFSVNELPSNAQKYRANGFASVGGGCAANAAVAIARLGGSASLVSRLGDDFTADLIIFDLEKEGVNCAHVQRIEGFASPLSAVMVDEAGERMIVGYRDDDIPQNADYVTDAWHANSYSAVLADSRWATGSLALFQLANEKQVPTIYDGEAPFDENGRKAAILASHPVFSTQGLARFSGTENVRDGLVMAVSQRDGRWTAVTDGSKGILISENESIYHMPGFKVDAVDTLGAGDVWHGAFTLALSEKQTIEQALNFASATAALKCMKFGGRKGSPSRLEVEQLLSQNYNKLVETK